MLSLELSDRQKRIIGAALTTISLLFLLAVAFWCAVMVVRFVSYFSSVLLPLAVAAILATLLRPYYLWLLKWLKSGALSVTVVLLTFFIPASLLIYQFGLMLTGKVSGFLGDIPVWIEQIRLLLQEKMPHLLIWLEQHDVINRVKAMLEGRVDLFTKSTSMIKEGVLSTGNLLFQYVAVILNWVVMPVYFVFMIQAPVITMKNVEMQLTFFKPETRSHVIYLITEFIGILVAFFRGQFIIALCQGILFAIGFSIVGLPHGAILGFLLGLLNVVPYLGNMIGLAVVLPLAWFHPVGGPGLLLAVVIIFVFVQMFEGYFLTPKIMGKTTGLHPMAIIFAIFFWGTALSGLMGMILAIPLTAFLVVFWRLLKTYYIREWV
ncbi:MAG TPA: AI-2E family transporter [Kiritimatiellia bacterium]|nr:AI-2E family transporter [Kiritimatiellia bacterium]